MKKLLLCTTSVCALFIANNALAAGYVCEESDMVYVSCAGDFHLQNGKCLGCAAPDLPILSGLTEADIEWGVLPDVVGFPSFNHCAFKISKSFKIPNGNVDAPIYCAIYPSENPPIELVGVKPGDYFCYTMVEDTADDELGVKCNAGYYPVGFGHRQITGSTFSAAEYALLPAQNIFYTMPWDLTCAEVPAGNYYKFGYELSEPQPLYALNTCADTTDGGIARGQYCPAKSTQPKQCSQATNVADGTTIVYGITGIEGATSETDCHLPAGDTIYTNNQGSYKLVSQCDYAL